MAHKSPMIYLTNGRNHICRLCKCDLLLQEKTFEMKQVGGKKPIAVREMILYCPNCQHFYVTQAMSRDIVMRHPGYYIDTSVYDLKPSKKSKIRKGNTEPVDLPQAVHQKKASPPIPESKHHLKSDTVKPENKPETLHRSVASGLDAQIYLSNTYSSANNICPLCSSVLGKELVNIPVTEVNGDFYRYYADEVKFCYKCRKAYISKDTISSILNRMNSGARTTRTVKLENATVYRNENNTDYLYSPTLSNSHAVYFPGNDYRKNGASQNASMELNAQSFLGEMGYSVNKEGNIRRHILIEAVKKFGKRRVTDHIAFLIATRKAQENGAIKYAHAIRIWQEDINYITEV